MSASKISAHAEKSAAKMAALLSRLSVAVARIEKAIILSSWRASIWHQAERRTKSRLHRRMAAGMLGQHLRPVKACRVRPCSAYNTNNGAVGRNIAARRRHNAFNQRLLFSLLSQRHIRAARAVGITSRLTRRKYVMAKRENLCNGRGCHEATYGVMLVSISGAHHHRIDSRTPPPKWRRRASIKLHVIEA